MNWEAAPTPDQKRVKDLQEALGVSKTIGELLVQRAIDSYARAKTFFRPQWEDLHDPFLMLGMEKAVQRIDRALTENQSIMVYGDYDVDGTTSVALMTTYLKQKGGRITPYIPDRYTEGYGISYQGIDHALANGIQLIIALDCGVKAIDKVAYAKEKGLDFIVCDHHLPGEELPDTVALLNPKQPHCSYPFKELCGCGIGFKLLQGLTHFWKEDPTAIVSYLDLVTTATAADIVPMVGENRVLCFFGLKQIRENSRPGIKRLLGALKRPATISDLVFRVAPRINAAGRMDHALTAVQLLMTEDQEALAQIADQIEHFNSERRSIEKRITEEALQQLAQSKEHSPSATVVYADHWHKGVVGIVAARLIETHYRPTIVLTRSGDQYVGSVRSVKGFDVYAALVASAKHLVQFGGHKYAAGLTLDHQQLDAFKAAFDQAVSAAITPDQLEPKARYDTALPLDAIDDKLYRIVEQMAPFGPQNMRPIFYSENCIDSGASCRVGKDQTHLKLSIQTPNGPIAGIGFGLADYYPAIASGRPFDVLYTLDENEWNGQRSLQLKIKHLRLK